MVLRLNTFLICIVLLCLVSSCNTYKPFYNDRTSEPVNVDIDSIQHQIIFTGDLLLNGSIESASPFLKILAGEKIRDNSSLLLLGNIFEKNYLESFEEEVPDNEALRKIYKLNQGQVYLLSGNNEWDNGSSKSGHCLENFEMAALLPEHIDHLILHRPQCPGPFPHELSDNTVLLLFNSQWWFHDKEKDKKLFDKCEIDSEEEFLNELKSLLTEYRDKNVIIAMHHPLFSRGERGGLFPLRTHLFPLTEISKALFVPLPGLGSFYTFFKSINGTSQDLANANYVRLRKSLMDITEAYDNLIFLSAHEDGSQHFYKDNKHFAVSAMVSDKAYIRKGSAAEFLTAAPSYGKIIEDKKGALWLEFNSADDNSLLYSKKLLEKPKSRIEIIEDLESKFSFPNDSLIKVKASERYDVSKFKRFFLGEHYRESWSTSIGVPVKDLRLIKGGLNPVKRGGGFATRSLRLENADGYQWVLRTVDKNTDKTLPSYLRKTFVANIVQDQTSASHPYASLVIPAMADRLGIFHAKPELVYIPHQPALAEFDEDFGGDFYLFEERPNDNMDGYDNFGNSEEVESYSTAIEKTTEEHDHRIDQRAVLRARIFDMLIADWDRHDDQWRWATFKEGETTWYRPIPRDRDQPFFKFDGFLPWFASRKWLFPIGKFQEFKEYQPNIVGFNFNARYFDRAFLTDMEWSDWEAEIDFIQSNLSDAIIDSAFLVWPDSIYQLDAKNITDILKKRRDNLSDIVDDYYRFLSKEVNIVGTDDDEAYEINVSESGSMTISIWDLSKERDKKEILYQREFKEDETREVRVYMMKGDDEITILGENTSAIRVRIIGGKGEDEILNKAEGNKTRIIAYDKPGGMKIKVDHGIRDRRSKRKDWNEYDRYDYKYSKLLPTTFLGYNGDDGIFLGLGLTFTDQKFKKDPFWALHKLRANYAFKNNGFNFEYDGYFVEAFSKHDLDVKLAVFGINYVRKYYGLGNESKNTAADDEFYNIKMRQIIAEPLLRRRFGGKHSIAFGPTFTSGKVEKTAGRIVDSPDFDRGDDQFVTHNELGLKFSYDFKELDNEKNPGRGFYTDLSAEYNQRINNLDINSLKLKAEVAFFYRFDMFLQPTIALKTGGGHIFGEFDFYESLILGERNNLRGFSVDRFSGSSSIYQNSELRLKLGTIRTVVFPVSIGILGFYDLGRVWVANDNSNALHRGYGGGIWITPYDLLAVTATYAQSVEDKRFILKFGFQF